VRLCLNRAAPMQELIFALSHYFAVGVLALLAYVFGRRLTLAVRYDSLLEQLGFSIALGLGLIAISSSRWASADY